MSIQAVRLVTAFLGAAALVACQSARPRTRPPADVPREKPSIAARAATFEVAPPALPGEFADALAAAIALPQPSDGELTLYFLDVGQADGTLIVCPNGQRHLVDLGTSSPQSIADPAAIRKTLRSLLDSTTPTLATLVVTHPDSDHYNLLAGALGDPNRSPSIPHSSPVLRRSSLATSGIFTKTSSIQE